MMHLKKIVLKSQHNEPDNGSLQHSLHGRSYLEVKQTEVLTTTNARSGQSIVYTSNCLLDNLEESRRSNNNNNNNSNNKTLPSTLSQLPSLTPLSWVNNFRDVYNENRHFAKHWFWDNFNWDTQSIWIGKFNKSNNLPDNNRQIADFLQRLVTDLNRNPKIKSQVYIKFYFSRNVKTNDPEINYLLICNGTELPEEFLGTLVDITFEKYQLTESILNKDKDFKRMLNHYLNWSNFYIYYNLMEELQY